MNKLRGIRALRAVLDAGPARLLTERGFTPQRRHFIRQGPVLIHVITFEVCHSDPDDITSEFDSVVWTTSREAHELETDDPFTESAKSWQPLNLASGRHVSDGMGPGYWQLDAEDPDGVQKTARTVCEDLRQFIIPYLDALQSYDDLLALGEHRSVSPHPVSRAAIAMLVNRPEVAVDTLCRWRARINSGSPKSQLSARAHVEKYAERLGLTLPDDGFVPLTEQEQLCQKLEAECEELAAGGGRYNHARNLLREIEKWGPVPARTEEIYRQARRAIWPTMSTKQVCRIAKQACRAAARATGDEARQLYAEAHAAFSVVAERDGIPAAYQELADTAAENAG